VIRVMTVETAPGLQGHHATTAAADGAGGADVAVCLNVRGGQLQIGGTFFRRERLIECSQPALGAVKKSMAGHNVAVRIDA
jgi:hypothetical protein